MTHSTRLILSAITAGLADGIVRAAIVAVIAALITFGLACGAKALPSHVDRDGTMIPCAQAATDMEVETCAGE